MQTVCINKQPVAMKQYKGNKVVTFKDIDLVHGRPDGTARKRFNDNKKHFIEGEDFFKIQPSEIRTVGIKSPNGGIVVTESGYLMLAKSFTDDLAWKVQRELVNCYFRDREVSNYEYFDKFYNGMPVLTAIDVSHFTGIARGIVEWFCKHKALKNVDCFFCTADSLKRYKKENPKTVKTIPALYLITESGFNKICKAYKIKIASPACFENKKMSDLEQLVLTPLNKPQKEYMLPFESEKFQDTIKKIKNEMITIDVILQKLNRHNMEKDVFECLRSTAKSLGDEICTDLFVLPCEKLNTTNKQLI